MPTLNLPPAGPRRVPVLLLSILLVLLAAAAGFAAPSTAALQDDLDVTRLDERGLEAVLRPRWSLLPLSTGGQLARAAHCSDPDRPRRRLQVALPPGSQVEVTVLGLATRACPGPLPDTGLSGANPEPVVAWQVEEWGDLRVLSIVADLVRDGGAAAALVEELRLRVDFIGGSGGFTSRLSALELASCLLNPGQAAGWARPRMAGRMDSPLWDGTHWVRLPVTQEGLYQVTPALLTQLGLAPAQLDPRAMKLYSYSGGHIDDAPGAARNSEFRPREIPLLREHDGDASFENGERLIFHGQGTALLRPTAVGTIGLRDHPYSDINVYWLLVGGGIPGREMAPIADPSGATPFPLSAVRWRGLLNEHKTYGETSALACVGDLFRAGTRATYTFPAPLGGPTALRLEYDFYPDLFMQQDSLRFEINGQVYPLSGRPHSTQLEATLNLGGDQLRITLERLSDTGLPIHLNWLMPSFEAPARFIDGQLAFELPPVAGSYQVQIQQAPASFYVVDVTDFDSLRVSRQALLTDRVPAVGGGPAGRARRYFGATDAALRTPVGASLATMPDLKREAGSAELIVIAPAAFADAAAELAAVRRAAGMTARLAVLEDIYAEFNCGVVDPGAVRNFLRHEWLHAPDPAGHVLLVGNGHYDYRGLVAGGYPSRMPAWYLYSTSTSDADAMIDDWFVQLATPGRLEMSLGRLPANSATEVAAYTAKLAAYTDGTARGPWRNRLLFVGDDEHGEGDQVNSFEMSHSQDTEELIRNRVPDAHEVERLYLFEYPSVYNPSIRVNQKPLAEARLVAALNEGVALVNFLGHGNNTTWTHEYVFNAARHYPLLQANGRPAAYIAATCSWAEVDLPIGEAFPQQLINMAGGGAIGVLAATRKTGGFSNNNFVDDLLTIFFSRDEASGRPPAMGEAVRLAKNISYDSNRRKYIWLGDPSLPPGFPGGGGEVLGLSSGGVAVDTLLSHGLAGVEIATSGEGHAPVRDGVVTVSARQAPVPRRHDYDPYTSGTFYHGISLDYESPGPLLYSGSVDLAAGRASVRFMVPGDILEGARGRLRFYYEGRTEGGEVDDGLVYLDPPFTRNPSPGTDAEPPRLRLFLNGPQWRPDDWVAPNSRIVLQVSDSSGINLTGEIGHRLEVEIDGGMPRDLTSTFEYDRGSWTTGEARLDLPRLDPGEHGLRARAFDNYNNPGYAETTFRVVDDAAPRLAEVVNFPNPVGERTRFTFHLLGAQPTSLPDCELQVYTVKGRRVARERLALAGQGGFLWSEEWRPRNDRGEALARGIYLYRLALRLPEFTYSLIDGQGQYVVRRQRAATVEATGKLIVE
ncbi:MAG: C25 family cysteine peptidase [bacterium]|nr:C25 family cysteine peptidase [bacterium]